MRLSFSFFIASTYFFLALQVPSLCGRGFHERTINSGSVVERKDLNDLFKPRTPWLGADVALSVRLNQASYLWVWGDTLVGNMTVNGHRNIRKMVHDSFSVADANETFIKHFIPNTTSGFLKPTPTSSPSYYWVVAGLSIEKLFFLCMTIEKTNSSIGFRQVSSDIVIIDNFQHGKFHPPSEWLYRSQNIPNSKNSNCTWNEGIVVADINGEPLNSQGEDFSDGEYVYILGKCVWSTNSGAALSRIRKQDLLQFSTFTNNSKSKLFEYLFDDDTWTTNFSLSNLKMLFSSNFSEGNLVYNKFLNSWYILLCQAFDPVVHIALSTSKSLYKGNWNVNNFYNIPDKFLNKTEQLISYASKSHPEYAPQGKDRYIVFSFNTNTLNGLKPLERLDDIYHPHFVQVDLLTYKFSAGERRRDRRRRQLFAPVRDSIAAEMGVLPAPTHHATNPDAGANNGRSSSPNGNSNYNMQHNNDKVSDSSSISKNSAGPKHSFVSPTEIALGISAMNSHDGEDTGDCKDKGGLVTLLCHTSKIERRKKEKELNQAQQHNEEQQQATKDNDNRASGNSSPSPSPSPPSPSSLSSLSPTKAEKSSDDEQKIKSMAVHDVTVKVETTKGSFRMTVKPKWSPQGAAQFLSLVAAGFYDNVAIFRVLPGFVAQFGINGNPQIQKQYGTTIPDDPPAHISNALGTVSFAAHGPNSRSTQVFFNTMDNARLDAMNFQPFAVVERKSFDIITSFYGQYGESVNQGRIFQEGNSFLKMNYPKLDYIVKMTVEELST